MSLHGHTKIELHNVKTGEDKVIEKDNLITNVFGKFLSSFHRTGLGMNNLSYKSQFPLMQSTHVGGVVCYPDSIDEDENIIFAPVGNVPTAYANQTTHTDTNLKRGQPNVNVTETLENGFTFVWDWGLEQGNGVISAICLTSDAGGACEFGDEFSVIPMTQLGYTNLTRINATESIQALQRSGQMDSSGFRWAVMPVDATTVKLYKLNMCITQMGVYDKILTGNGVPFESWTVALSAESISLSGNYSKGMWFDFGDYMFGICNSANNTSGNATICWSKIYKEDRRVEEGSWTLNETHLHYIADNGKINDNSFGSTIYAACANGCFYICNATLNGIYKIDPNDIANIKLYETGTIGTTHSGSYYGSTTTVSVENVELSATGSQTTIFDVIKSVAGRVYWQTGYINGDDIFKMPEKKSDVVSWSHFVQVDDSPVFLNFGGSYGNLYASRYPMNNTHISVWLLKSYLFTINNLDEPVTKTADMTMRITYTISLEEDE